MDLNQHKNNIENHFKIYETVQTNHLSILKSEQIPDLNAMTTEREKSFVNLKKSLDNLIGNAGSIGGTKSISLLTQFENRLNIIMSLDEQIEAEIKKYRVELKKNLNHMKQGKAAMKGYSPMGADPNRPHVVSMNR